MELQVDRTETEAVVIVDGDMDVDTAYDVYTTVVAEAEAGFSVVVLDLAAVSFIDSTGLSMLVRARDELPRHFESRLRLRDPSTQAQRLLNVTALTNHFDLVE